MRDLSYAELCTALEMALSAARTLVAERGDVRVSPAAVMGIAVDALDRQPRFVVEKCPTGVPREGATNVVRVRGFGQRQAFAYELDGAELRDEIREKRARDIERLTTAPVANENETGRSISPALTIRMAMKGRLARIAAGELR